MLWRAARTRRARSTRPTPGLAERRLFCTVCVRACAGVRLVSFMQSGYRIISDMSHISLLFPRRPATAFGATCPCPRYVQHSAGKSGPAGPECTVPNDQSNKIGSWYCCLGGECTQQSGRATTRLEATIGPHAVQIRRSKWSNVIRHPSFATPSIEAAKK